MQPFNFKTLEIFSIQNFQQLTSVLVMWQKFDTTCNTNRYGMTFAPFMGVNNYGQTIIFVCSLLSDETSDLCVVIGTIQES